MANTPSCWSCEYYRHQECERNEPAWPNGTPENCDWYSREPGSDIEELDELEEFDDG